MSTSADILPEAFHGTPGIDRGPLVRVGGQGHQEEGIPRPDGLRLPLGGPRGDRRCEEAEGGKARAPALADGGASQDAARAGMVQPLRRGHRGCHARRLLHRRDDRRGALLHKEQQGRARPRDAPDEEGEPAALVFDSL